MTNWREEGNDIADWFLEPEAMDAVSSMLEEFFNLASQICKQIRRNSCVSHFAAVLLAKARRGNSEDYFWMRQKDVSRTELPSVEVSEKWDACGDCVKVATALCFLSRRRQKLLGGLWACSPGKCFHFSNRWKCTVESAMFVCMLLAKRVHLIVWLAWANISACTSYIDGFKSWRLKKIVRTQTDWTLAEVQCQWRNGFGIHEHFWKLKRQSYLPEECQCVRNACVGVRAWNASKCVRLESSARTRVINLWFYRRAQAQATNRPLYCFHGTRRCSK